MACVKGDMKQIILLSKFQENHFPKLIGLLVTKNVETLMFYMPANPTKEKKKTEGTASRRNII